MWRDLTPDPESRQADKEERHDDSLPDAKATLHGDVLCAVAVAALAGERAAANPAPRPLPPLREQAAIRQQWLKLRLERVLPGLMRKHGVQMWLVVCREYTEDPVFYSLVSPTVFAARRRTDRKSVV